MTGFARLSGRVSDSLGFTLSLKSVNHRFLDPQLRMPPGLESLEMRVRRLLKEKLVRGHIDFTLTLERTAQERAQERAGERDAETSPQYNRALVAAYIAAFRAAAAEHSLDQQPDLNAILRLPGALSADKSSAKDDPRALEAAAEAALEAAVLAQLDPLIAALNLMRAQEGASLAAELAACLDRLAALVDRAEALRGQVQAAYFERIRQRVAALVHPDAAGREAGGRDAAVEFDRDRILQEVALLVERSDVDEEIARLRIHIEHFRSLLRAGGEIGKKADFLLQEMNREANTLLSKTSGVAGNAAAITELGLGMKAEIEKAREQVQNLE
jgi:uncharacterized protein (TIGR00255 family)